MSAQQLIAQLADSARAAGKTLSASTGEQRRNALNAIADAIVEKKIQELKIQEAREEDEEVISYFAFQNL